MSKTPRIASWMVVLSLTVPALAEAQKNRTTGSSGNSGNSGSSGSSGSTSSSRGGGGRSVDSGSSPSNNAPAPPAPPRISSDAPRSVPRSKDSAPSYARTHQRQPPAPGGYAVSPKQSDPVRLGTASAVAPSGIGSEARVRGAQLPSGYAIARPVSNVDVIIAFPYYGPWGYWYPWYGGFGWGYGYVGYNPWFYGATCWGWGRYGFWYDPAAYHWAPEPDTAAIEPEEEEPTVGTVRIRSNQDSARVYVDGQLVGIVDDFNGLSDHLELEKGRHTIELQADGFEPARTEVNVKAGRTQTVRVNLKR